MEQRTERVNQAKSENEKDESMTSGNEYDSLRTIIRSGNVRTSPGFAAVSSFCSVRTQRASVGVFSDR